MVARATESPIVAMEVRDPFVVVLFADGYDAWLEAGLPIEEGL